MIKTYGENIDEDFEKAINSWKERLSERLKEQHNSDGQPINCQGRNAYDEFDERLVMNSSVAY